MLPHGFEDFTGYFNQLCKFLHKYSWLYDCPVTSLLTSDVFSKIPDDWAKYLLLISNEELNNVPTGLIKDDCPTSLKGFLSDCKRLTLPVLRFGSASYKSYDGNNWLETVPREIWKGMTPKKRVEVEIMSTFVHQKSQLQGVNKIVDLGSGLGYIDRLLLLQGYNILGIESQTKLVEFAIEQKNLFFPPNIAANLNYVSISISETSIAKVKNAIVSDLLSSKTLYVNSINKIRTKCDNLNKYDWKKVLTLNEDMSSNQKSNKVCMIGLHACGDLAVTALKMYTRLSEVSSLMLVPCCYHKMALMETHNERKDFLYTGNGERFKNFPLSATLKESSLGGMRNFSCRPFLRLASQGSNSNWQGRTEADHQQHSFNVLSRAVFELFAQQENASFKKCFRRFVKKTSLKCQDFLSYVDECLMRCDFTSCSQANNAEDDKDRIRSILLDMWKQHCDKLRLVEVITALQMCLEPVAESLVVADRFCFLKEQGVENVEIIKMIDNKLSPRCLAFVVSKS